MKMLPHMVSMEKTTEEKSADCAPCMASAPDYPYGLCLRLTENELEKLGMTHEDFSPEDIVHLHALGVVTSVSNSANKDDYHCSVEIQVTHLEAEDEEKENRSQDSTIKKLYK